VEIAVELQFLAVFFAILLVAQALFLVCWLAGRGVVSVVVAMRRRGGSR
jgi:hypothetical protein